MFIATCCSSAASKLAVAEGKLQGAGGLERRLLALARTLCQIARGLDERLAEVDARYPAAMGRREDGAPGRREPSRRPSTAMLGGDPGQLGQLRRRRQRRGCETGRGRRAATGASR